MSVESRPLTLLKAYRIVHNLDTNKICEQAKISRSYLTRVEQGATPSAEIAARLVEVLTNVDCVRASQPSNTRNQLETFESARRLLDRIKVLHTEFAREGLREIHLLYPKRFQLGEGEHVLA
ncbi:helix-turn-helix domain-containing protein [Trinickia dinghuensis]|uniref:XRE family transcriptional regulator n=1 Tax=Trinickia dinghuensis TaxID=2291023 RepID=A0A3D8K0F9_9BURK|nr:helix-turn-helix transcriptional regulator [Trinickia dinghuensis]RDU98739.1 XRE family transcriptional regulator [Trinickia dinghuensis]